MDLGDSRVLMALHDAALEGWYGEDEVEGYGEGPDTVDAGDSVKSTVLAQHYCNYSLWNHEDQARRRDVDDSYIADIKRAIDGWNQRRNDLIEKVDEAILREVDGIDISGAAQHSESGGMIVDRLSILSLKIWHMRINASRTDDAELAAECAGKLATLERQRSELAACLAQLMSEFREGRRFFRVYRQFKAYNDPRLNPAVAGSS